MQTYGTHGNARRGLGLAAILLASGLFAASAAATPVNLFGDPANGFGFNPADVAAATGVGSLSDQQMFLISGVYVDISITTPSTIPGSNNPGGNFANPSTGSSMWSITANDRDYEDLWLVLVGHAVNSDLHGPSGDGFYDPANVGIEIDDSNPNLRFVSPDGFDITYLAVFLGDLAQGATTVLPIEYRVAQGLFEQAPNDFLFPQYKVAYLEGIPVPEPSLLALGIVVGALGRAVRVRRHRE